MYVLVMIMEVWTYNILRPAHLFGDTIIGGLVMSHTCMRHPIRQNNICVFPITWAYKTE